MSSDENQQALAWQQIIRNRAFYNVNVQRGESWVDAACRTLDELVDQKEQAEKSLSEFLASQLTSSDDELTQLDEARIEANIQRNRAQRERDAAVSRVDDLNKKFAKLMSDYQDIEDERDEWKARAEEAPAVPRADIERVVHRYIDGGFDELHISRVKSATDTFMALLSGDDPAVFVVRESDLPAVGRTDDGWTDGTRHGWEGTSETATECVETHLEWARFYAAAARAIEAEQSVDPIEAKARELWEIGRGMSVNIELDDIAPDHRAEYLSIARHLLGQEDRHVDQ